MLWKWSQTECVESKRAFSCIVFQQFTLKVLIFWWTGQMVGVYLMYRLSLEKQLQLVIRFYIFCRILIFTWRCFISELPSSLSLNFNLVYARILNMTKSKYFHPVSHEYPNFNYYSVNFIDKICFFSAEFVLFKWSWNFTKLYYCMLSLNSYFFLSSFSLYTYSIFAYCYNYSFT